MVRDKKEKRVIIMGAGGRDFHNFNMVYRQNSHIRVTAFTAAQIPGIEEKVYPAALAGALYPEGIPIVSQERLSELIKKHSVDQIVFSYSDISHEMVGHHASVALAAGADFVLLGPDGTMLDTDIPVISVCAVRTGCGKSQLTRHICDLLKKWSITTVVIRHPMAYGDLYRQRVQRFATIDDINGQECTIEEREEYEPLIARNAVVFAGVDYGEVLKQAEAENPQIILWDGGNNDFPFVRSDLEIVLLDPFRPGHGVLYHPGETNLRRAHVLVVNKVNSAPAHYVERVLEIAFQTNPEAQIVKTASVYHVDRPDAIRNRRVLVVEDGPTLTHGEMPHGIGYLAAQELGAREIVNPKPFAQGSLEKTFALYPHIAELLPAIGYGAEQMADLEATINQTPADVVLVATPVDLASILTIKKESVRLVYEIQPMDKPRVEDILAEFLKKQKLL
jgi:predicted GTPase